MGVEGSKLQKGGQARVYVLTRQDVKTKNVMVSSTTSVCSYRERALFDSGSTHSYVTFVCAKYFVNALDQLGDPFLVTTPMRECLLVKHIYCAPEIFVSGRESFGRFNGVRYGRF